MPGASGRIGQVTRDTRELSFGWVDPLFSITYVEWFEVLISDFVSMVYQTFTTLWVSCEIFSDAEGSAGRSFASITLLAI
jgi:hypothetical protein